MQEAVTQLAAEMRKARVGSLTLRGVTAQTGFSPSYICDIENARRVPPPDTIQALAQVYHVAPDRWLWLWVVAQMGEDKARLAAAGGAQA